jgi:Cytochrome C oxidase, cbb3-type, subunit III
MRAVGERGAIGCLAFFAVTGAVFIAACGGSSRTTATTARLPGIPVPGPHASLLLRENYYLEIAARKARRSSACARVRQATVPATDSGTPDHALLSVLAALRKPYTATDALPRATRGNAPKGRFVRYIRLATVVDGVSYYIVPSSSPNRFGGPAQSVCFVAIAADVRANARQIPISLRAKTLALVARDLVIEREIRPRETGDGICLLYSGAQTSGGVCGANALDVRDWGLEALFGRVSGVVPDGVARVTIHDPAYDGVSTATSTVRVVNNVFVSGMNATLAGRTFDTAPTVTWRSANGAIIKTVSGREPGVGGSAWGSGPSIADRGTPNLVTLKPPSGLSRSQRATFRAGAALVEESGCEGCHEIGDNGNNGPGPPLTHIGATLRPGAISAALRDPTAPMPSFKDLAQTSPKKFRALVEFLRMLK